MKTEKKAKFFRDGHDYWVAIVSAVVSAILGTVGTALVSSNVVYHDYLSYHSITNLVETYFVQADLVEADILSVDSPQPQLEKIANAMKEQKNKINDLDEERKNLLDGKNSIEALRDDYKNQVDELSTEKQTLEEEKKSLTDEIAKKNKEIEEKDKVIDQLKQGVMPPIEGTQLTALTSTKSRCWNENSGNCWDSYGSDYSNTTNYITTFDSGFCEYRAEKKYRRIHGYVATQETGRSATIRIIADNTVVWSRTIDYKDGRVEFDKNINNCEFLTIETGNYCDVIFSDIYVE